jgi:CHASE3 domain sensor protein
MADDNTSKDMFQVFLKSVQCGNPNCKERIKELEAKYKDEAYWLESARNEVRQLEAKLAVAEKELAVYRKYEVSWGEIEQSKFILNQKLTIATEALKKMRSNVDGAPNEADEALAKIEGEA